MTISQSRTEARKDPISTETWLGVEAWTPPQQALTAKACRKLDIELKRTANDKMQASQVLRVLGKDSFAKFSVVRTEGIVIWCNFDLARELGFDVPPSNQLTSAFHNELLAALSVQVVELAEATTNHEMITMYADRYGGDGVRPGLGAGRAGFLPYGNLYIKGVGFTPLFKHNDPNDFVHSHGAVHLEDCLSEALFGELDQNLYTQGAARVVAIIDQGRYVTAPSGKRIPVALLVRTGAQLRPAHLLVNHTPKNRTLLNKFISITRATGQLVTNRRESTSREIADVRATMLRIIDDQACTAAEGFRWRMLHGAISSSNMEMSGAMLDLATQSSQPRTAPILLLDYAESVFGTEHTSRALRLIPVYRKLVRETTRLQRKRFNIKWLNLTKQMEQAYHKHLQVRLLSACGLKTEVAQRIQAERPELASSFTELILEMAALKNPGSVCVAKSMVEYVSVFDIFHLFKSFPPIYFKNPTANHTRKILNHLKPVFRGNRFHVAKKKAEIKLLVNKIAGYYGELMETCAIYAKEYYGDLKNMRSSIIARAAFENEPCDLLYYQRLHRDLKNIVATYQSTRDSKIIRQAVDQRITVSLRSIDAILAQGSARRMADGGIELEMRTIEGINYSVRAWDDEGQTRVLHVSIPTERDGNYYSTKVNSLRRLTILRIQSLRYCFTTDNWLNSAEAKAYLTHNEQGCLSIDFDGICIFPLIGQLEGAFHVGRTSSRVSRKGKLCLGGYVFAIPDKQELISVAAKAIGS